MGADARQPALAFGRRVHDRLARALRDRDPLAGADAESPGETRDCLQRAAASPIFRELLRHSVRVEDAFDLYGLYTGRIDAWYEADENTAVVVDWKTGDCDRNVLHLQRLIYALALLCHYETVRVRTVNIGSHLGPDEEERFTSADVRAMHAELAEWSNRPREP